MAKASQIIFTDGKEEALKALFNGDGATFGYLAVGYESENNGFEDPSIDENATETGFNELDDSYGYTRVPLTLYDSNSIEKDPSTGKVLAKFSATLTENNITESQDINQIAIVNRADVGHADTKIYSATTFPPFTKNRDSAITFVIAFKL